MVNPELFWLIGLKRGSCESGMWPCRIQSSGNYNNILLNGDTRIQMKTDNTFKLELFVWKLDSTKNYFENLAKRGAEAVEWEGAKSKYSYNKNINSLHSPPTVVNIDPGLNIDELVSRHTVILNGHL